MPDIKDHYQEMYLRWSQYSEKGYYEKWTIYAYVAWRIIRPCDSGLSCRGELFITVLRLQNTESRDKDLETRSASKGTSFIWGPAEIKEMAEISFFSTTDCSDLTDSFLSVLSVRSVVVLTGASSISTIWNCSTSQSQASMKDLLSLSITSLMTSPPLPHTKHLSDRYAGRGCLSSIHIQLLAPYRGIVLFVSIIRRVFTLR